MVEAEKFIFDHKEVAEALIKHQGIHEGIWGVSVRFGFNATNVGPSEDELAPSVIVGVLKIGLQKFPKENSLSVDAAKVNPRPKPKRKTTKKRTK
ncbi:MAG: hypothetical protein IH828_09215 [Nitrospinae bacterium]|nr:hypothetical protein [Nitrospinota bacterium]